MKNGLLRDLVILICSKRNFWQPLSTRIFSRVLWCAEIAAVLTFWAFRGEINSCKGLTMTMAMRQPLIENNSWLFEDLRSYNHVWSKDLNAIFFDNITLIQLDFPKIVLDNLKLDDFCFQSRVALFCFLLPFLWLHYMLFLQDEDIHPLTFNMESEDQSLEQGICFENYHSQLPC